MFPSGPCDKKKMCGCGCCGVSGEENMYHCCLCLQGIAFDVLSQKKENKINEVKFQFPRNCFTFAGPDFPGIHQKVKIV